MYSKRVSEEPAEGDTKKLKRDSTSEEVRDSVTFKYYPPGSIFNDNDNDPHEMAGSTNTQLATSFYHSRYSNGNKKIGVDDRRGNFERNAGAVQLYEKDGVTLYKIPGQDKHKEYNFVSYGNKEFRCYTNQEFKVKSSTYGHSERILMKMVLDDLIGAHGDGERPSDDCASDNISEQRRIYEVLRNLTNKASQYREYLEKKNIIVKMWSERPSCSCVTVVGAGGGCECFMKRICPAGSQFGWIVKDYKLEDNKGPKVEEAFKEFQKAYKAYCEIV